MALLTNDMALRLSGLANTAQSVGAATPQTQAVVQQAAKAVEAMQPKNPFTLVDYGGYVSPERGAVKYGVGFGGGLGGDSATQQLFGKAPDLAGLWAMGFDQSDPNFNYKLWEFHNDKMKTDPDYKNYVTKEAAKNNWNLNDAQGITYGADWYYRDLARRMGKSNSFLDSTIGKILSPIAQIGLGFIPGVGPLLSAGLGAGIGASQNGLLGGVLGGLGGYGAGSLGASLATNGIGGTISNALDSVSNLFGGSGGGGFTNAAALGNGSSLTSGLSNAANIGGVGGPLSSGISALTPNLGSLGGAATLGSQLGGGGALLSGIGALTPNLASLGGAASLANALGNGAVNAAGGNTFGLSDIPTPSANQVNAWTGANPNAQAIPGVEGIGSPANYQPAPIIEGAASTAEGAPFVTSPTGIGGTAAGAGLLTAAGGGLANAGGGLLNSIGNAAGTVSDVLGAASALGGLFSPTAAASGDAGGGGALGAGWGGQFQKYKSPYSLTKAQRKKFSNAFRSA